MSGSAVARGERENVRQRDLLPSVGESYFISHLRAEEVFAPKTPVHPQICKGDVRASVLAEAVSLLMVFIRKDKGVNGLGGVLLLKSSLRMLI